MTPQSCLWVLLCDASDDVKTSRAVEQQPRTGDVVDVANAIITTGLPFSRITITTNKNTYVCGYVYSTTIFRLAIEINSVQ